MLLTVVMYDDNWQTVRFAKRTDCPLGCQAPIEGYCEHGYMSAALTEGCQDEMFNLEQDLGA